MQEVSNFPVVERQLARFDRASLRPGSSFKGSDVADANFDGANLTDANMSAIELAGHSAAPSWSPTSASRG